MKKMKRILGVALVLAMILSLTACGKKDAVKMPEEAKDIVAAIQENVKDSKDLSANMKMELSMDMMGQSMNMVTNMDMIINADPYQAKINMLTDMGESGSQEMLMYMGSEEDKYYMYVNSEGTWAKQEMDKAAFDEAAQNYSSQFEFDKFLESEESFEKKGTEDINGKPAVLLEGVVSGEALKEILNETQGMSGITGTEGDIDDSVFDNLADMPVKLWVYEETVTPAKISMDMSAVMESLTDAMLASEEESNSLELNISKFVMEMTYNSFEKVEKVEIPEEAKQAEAVPAE